MWPGRTKRNVKKKKKFGEIFYQITIKIIVIKIK